MKAKFHEECFEGFDQSGQTVIGRYGRPAELKNGEREFFPQFRSKDSWEPNIVYTAEQNGETVILKAFKCDEYGSMHDEPTAQVKLETPGRVGIRFYRFHPKTLGENELPSSTNKVVAVSLEE